MKHIVKIIALLIALSAIWISLLQTSVIPDGYTWLVSFPAVLIGFSIAIFSSLLPMYFILLSTLLYQLPIYFIMSLGCYGLLMVGVGLMQFPTCPHEAILLQQDIIEAKEFLKEKGVDIGPD